MDAVRRVQKEATREKIYGNIDTEKSHLNQIICGNMDYVGAVERTLKHEYYTKPDRKGRLHKPPKWLALGVVLTYSPEARIEDDPEQFQKWIEKSVQYLKERFPGTEQHLVLHLDESTPHIQGLITLNTNSGKISRWAHIKGKQAVRDLHTEYNERVKEFGLVRGEEYKRDDPEREQILKEYRNIRRKTREMEKKVKEMQEAGNAEYKRRIAELQGLKIQLAELEKLVVEEREKLAEAKRKTREFTIRHKEAATIEGEVFGSRLPGRNEWDEIEL